MNRVSKELWVGTSDDAQVTDLPAVLNVANDLKFDKWTDDDPEYAHVGLVDGPGNELGDYCAAVLCLRALVRRHERVLVCDHDGRRALVVALMYLNLCGGQVRSEPTAWSHWPTWRERLVAVCKEYEVDVPAPHRAHVEAFDSMPWGLLVVL